MCFADTIRRNLDQGWLTGAVFIDLRKAFDTVNHEVPLSKLRGLGVMHREHEWFRNYLYNRTQVVEFQGVSSTAEPVSAVVPQGSILGPLLFILHLTISPVQWWNEMFSCTPTILSYFSQPLKCLLSRLL